MIQTSAWQRLCVCSPEVTGSCLVTSVACTMEPRKIRKLKVLTGFRPVSDPLPRCFRTLFFFILLAFSFLSSFLFWLILAFFSGLFFSFLFFSFLFFIFSLVCRNFLWFYFIFFHVFAFPFLFYLAFSFFSFLLVFFPFLYLSFFPVVFSFLLEPYGPIHDTSNIDLTKNLSRASDAQVSRKAGPRRVKKERI